MNQALPQSEEIARAAFRQIEARFSTLQISEELESPVEISLHLPVQDGLKHALWLSLQNTDELHMAVGHFWCEWFPCTDPDKVAQFVDAVGGFLAGRYRILEHYRGANCFKAQLQRPGGNGWETISTWSRSRWPSFRKVVYREIVNA